jgi:hypothetical protein
VQQYFSQAHFSSVISHCMQRNFFLVPVETAMGKTVAPANPLAKVTEVIGLQALGFRLLALGFLGFTY